MQTRRETGLFGEDFAAAKLREDGYEILERSYRSGRNEIDIIAQKGDLIAFVEVKTRASSSYTTPAGSLSKAQRRRIIAAAVDYLKGRGAYNTGEFYVRFDVFEITTSRAGSEQILRYAHLPGAFCKEDTDALI